MSIQHEQTRRDFAARLTSRIGKRSAADVQHHRPTALVGSVSSSRLLSRLFCGVGPTYARFLYRPEGPASDPTGKDSELG